jgi:hypothetical protein
MSAQARCRFFSRNVLSKHNAGLDGENDAMVEAGIERALSELDGN